MVLNIYSSCPTTLPTALDSISIPLRARDGVSYPHTPSDPESASDASPQDENAIPDVHDPPSKDEDSLSEVDDNVLSTGSTTPSSNTTTGEAIAFMNSADSMEFQNTQVHSSDSHLTNSPVPYNSSPVHEASRPGQRALELHVPSRSSGSPGSHHPPWLEFILNPEPPRRDPQPRVQSSIPGSPDLHASPPSPPSPPQHAPEPYVPSVYELGNPQRPQFTHREIGSSESHFRIVGIELPPLSLLAYLYRIMHKESEWPAPGLSPISPEINHTNTNGLDLPPIISGEDVPRVLEPPVYPPGLLEEHLVLDYRSVDYMLG